MSSRVAALLLTCLATACAQPPTQVVVRLATDLETPTELDAIRLVLLDAEGEVVREQDLVDFSIPGDGAYHEIGSFGVVPRAADASRRFEVRAQARGAGRELFTTRARTGFVSEQTIRLDLYLPASCLTVAVTCQPDETCGVVGCVSPDVDPRGLPSHAEGAPLDGAGDPRGPAAPIRLVAPLVGRRLLTRTPTLRVELGDGVDEPGVEICRDADCATVEVTTAAPGGIARPTLPAEGRRWFWRARGTVNGEAAFTRVSWFEVAAGDRGVDAACGARVDVDGDGLVDAIHGTPDAGGAGHVVIHRGGSAGIADPSAQITLEGDAGDRFGEAVGTVDVDGDGRSDVIVGAPDAPGGGAVIVALAGATRTVTLSVDGSARFGAEVAGLGDVDGDGYGDVAVADVSGTGPWTLHVFRGARGGIEATPAVTIEADASQQSDRVVLAGGADLDADGLDDLVIGLPQAGPSGVVAWLRGPRLDGWATLEPGGALDPDAEYGFAVATGELVGDGHCDVVVGAPGASTETGAVHWFEGGATPSHGGSAGMGAAGSRNGQAVALCDLGYDGADELIAAGSVSGQNRELRIYTELTGGVSRFSGFSWSQGVAVRARPALSRVGAFSSRGVPEGGGVVVGEAGADVTFLYPPTATQLAEDARVPRDGAESGFDLR